jgi:formylglycine-generating enzyme required for sulfatase activity
MVPNLLSIESVFQWCRSAFFFHTIVRQTMLVLFLVAGCSVPPVVPPDSLPRGSKITNEWGMSFVYISPGSFHMGSFPEEPGRNYDEARHRVIITKGFHMQTTEVTQKQWELVMDDRPSFFKDCGGDCPVEMVSWNDVQEYIRRLNRLENTTRYRLPTEAEWEYACRAGSEAPLYDVPMLVDGFESSTILDRIAWCGDNSYVEYAGGQTCINRFLEPDITSSCGTNRVALKQPNRWGLYDMLGNVWEWCQDWYGAYPSSQATDPSGAGQGDARVFRGCAWDSAWNYCRAANRDGFSPGGRGFGIGFRLVMSE